MCRDAPTPDASLLGRARAVLSLPHQTFALSLPPFRVRCSLPVVFVPSPVADGARRQLPFASTWLDYCDISYLAPESAAPDKLAMQGMLDRLENVSVEEAAQRQTALRGVRDAFVARQGPTQGQRPSMADFLLREACAIAQREPVPLRQPAGLSRRSLAARRAFSKATGSGPPLLPTSSGVERCIIAGSAT